MYILETGVIYFKNGRKKVGLYLFNGLNPKTLGEELFEFIVKLNNKDIYNSIKKYVEEVEVVTGLSEINKENLEIMREHVNMEDSTQWHKFKFEFRKLPKIAVNLLLGANFNQLINMSKLFSTQEYSEAESINHIYEIDVKNKQLTYFYGGINTNQNWQKVKTIKFSEFVKNTSINSENFFIA